MFFVILLIASGMFGCDARPEYPQPSLQAIEAEVVSVTDGDTIVVEIDWSQRGIDSVERMPVRYIGIDTPEVTHVPGDWFSAEPYGKEAAEKNRALVGGKTVLLEWDVSITDRYDRYLCYVWVGDIFVNAELVRLGYAESVAYPPDTKYHEYFTEMEDIARSSERRIWMEYPSVVK